jgi:hypothetical protein
MGVCENGVYRIPQQLVLFLIGKLSFGYLT